VRPRGPLGAERHRSLSAAQHAAGGATGACVLEWSVGRGQCDCTAGLPSMNEPRFSTLKQERGTGLVRRTRLGRYCQDEIVHVAGSLRRFRVQAAAALSDR